MIIIINIFQKIDHIKGTISSLQSALEVSKKKRGAKDAHVKGC
ncbi:hypothetical protein V6C27_11295 [Peptococcaceae bacterium 1198_IL3148]